MNFLATVCIGFLVVFSCSDPKPVTVSDFCDAAGPDVARLRGLSDAEVAALTRPRKEAILSLRLKYQRLCQP